MDAGIFTAHGIECFISRTGYTGEDGFEISLPAAAAVSMADRLIEEATTGYSRVFWKYENIGSMQWGVQYAYAWLYPWVAGTGPNSTHANMLFGQVRYNLP